MLLHGPDVTGNDGDGLAQAGVTPDKQEPEWELFDLKKDPCEPNSVYEDPIYGDTVRELTAEMNHLQAAVGDEPYS